MTTSCLIRRRSRGKRLFDVTPSDPTGLGLTILVGTVSAMPVKLQRDEKLYGDARAALGAAGVDHPAATNGFHADSKSVGFLAAGDGWLIRAFHGCSQRKK